MDDVLQVVWAAAGSISRSSVQPQVDAAKMAWEAYNVTSQYEAAVSSSYYDSDGGEAVRAW